MRYPLRVTTLLTAALLVPQAAQAQEAAKTPRPADVSGLSLEPGLSMRVFQVDENMSRLPDLVGGQTGNVNKLVEGVDLRDADFGLDDRFLTLIDGWIVVERGGEYAFRLYNDDGAELSVGGVPVVINDGPNSGQLPADGEVELRPGAYPVLIRHYDGRVDARLLLQWKPPGAAEFVTVPASALRTEANQVRVTAPGKKQVELLTGDGRYRGRDPGDRAPLTGPHPAFEMVNLRAEGFEPKVGGMDFLPDGRLAVCLWDPQGDVLFLDNVAGDGAGASDVKVTRFATGMAEPLGLKVMPGRASEHQDFRLFVLQKQELTELIDHDGDGVADEYRAAVTGWPVTDNFHEFAFGLAERDGKFYANLAVAINPGGATTEPQIDGRGTTIELDPEAGTYRTVAAGLRTPNGVGVGYDGEVFATDNQGAWLPSSKIVHVRQDAFYNEYLVPPHPLSQNPVTPPAVWLPQGEIGNSPGNLLLAPESYGPYAGQMLHCDVTHGGVKRVFLEKVAEDGKVGDAGEYQGAVFRFSQGFEAGVNRIALGPDGDLYAGGIGSTGDWGQEGKKRFGLQKLSWTGEVPFEMLAVRPGTRGVEIEFTKPLASGSGETPGEYRVEQWYYEPTEEYGGPKMGEQTLDVSAVHVSPDRRRVFLETNGLLANRVVYIVLRGVMGEGDAKPWSTEAWYTMNRVPRREVGYANVADGGQDMNANDEAGFRPLFDGTLASARGHWRAFNGSELPAGWEVEDGALKMAQKGAGDIVSREAFGDFDLRFEWKVSEGGNSGVMYRVAEGDGLGAVWQTGPEYQILDDERHGDAKNGEDRKAASLYGLFPRSDSSSVKPAGEWNTGRIVVTGNRVEHHLNGVKVVDVEIGSDRWDGRVKETKFADMPRFAREPFGHIALQDHGDAVWFRDMRVKRLDDPRGNVKVAR